MTSNESDKQNCNDIIWGDVYTNRKIFLLKCFC